MITFGNSTKKGTIIVHVVKGAFKFAGCGIQEMSYGCRVGMVDGIVVQEGRALGPCDLPPPADKLHVHI